MILHFLITVLFIYGVHASTREGMVLSWVKILIFYSLIKVIKNEGIVFKILKPLFDCTPCMASVYGTISFFVYGSFYDPLLQSLVIWVFALCGFNFILNKILNR